jgi:hypothetical protein
MQPRGTSQHIEVVTWAVCPTTALGTGGHMQATNCRFPESCRADSLQPGPQQIADNPQYRGCAVAGVLGGHQFRRQAITPLTLIG